MSSYKATNGSETRHATQQKEEETMKTALLALTVIGVLPMILAELLIKLLLG